jgi:hypothetical protein
MPGTARAPVSLSYCGDRRLNPTRKVYTEGVSRWKLEPHNQYHHSFCNPINLTESALKASSDVSELGLSMGDSVELQYKVTRLQYVVRFSKKYSTHTHTYIYIYQSPATSLSHSLQLSTLPACGPSLPCWDALATTSSSTQDISQNIPELASPALGSAIYPPEATC